ncbi:MAG: hypothetical protein JO128_03395, partial [Alphaproteobacteria bacterium]|nr:hypothetical protein [Alphaproteobacteria bacterium]
RLELARLIEALSEDILAASDEEVRAAVGPGRKVARDAREVRLLVKAACEDVDGHLDGPGLEKDRAEGRIEPGAGPRPTGALRRALHLQRH